MKFKRIKPGLEVLDSRKRTVDEKITQIKSDYRDVFGKSTSDDAIEIAVRKRMDQKGGSWRFSM